MFHDWQKILTLTSIVCTMIGFIVLPIFRINGYVANIKKKKEASFISNAYDIFGIVTMGILLFGSIFIFTLFAITMISKLISY